MSNITSTITTQQSISASVMNEGGHTLSQLADIDLQAVANGSVLVYKDNEFVARTVTGDITIDSNGASTVESVDWSAVNNTPTTLAGYGITDAISNVEDVVDITTNQTIVGVKTFSSSPIVPTPILATAATTRGYVDTEINKVKPNTIFWDPIPTDEPRNQNAIAVQIQADNDTVVEGQPISENIEIGMSVYIPYTGTFYYSDELTAGTVFNSSSIANILATGINIVLNNQGVGRSVYSYNNLIAIDAGSDDLDTLTNYSISSSYADTFFPAEYNYGNGIIRPCNYIPDKLGQFIVSNYGESRQWVCSSTSPIVWSEITYIAPQIYDGIFGDDSAAAAGGVPINGVYRKSDGTVAWRQS